MIREWDDLRLFLTVARRGTIAAAAPQLDMVTATVRRRLEALESRVGEALFVSVGAGLAVSETGGRLLPIVERLESATRAFAVAAERERDAASGVVRVSASEVIAQYLLVPLFARLRRTHPDIAISLIAQNGPARFDPVEADVGVALIEPRSDDVACAIVGQFEMGLFGRTDLLDRIGRPRRPEDLRHMPLAGSPGHPWNIYGRLGLNEATLAFRVNTDSFAGQFDAVRSGMAIGACNVDFVARFDDVQRVLPDYRHVGPIWLATDAHQADVLRVEIVRDAIAEAIAVSGMAMPGDKATS